MSETSPVHLRLGDVDAGSSKMCGVNLSLTFRNPKEIFGAWVNTQKKMVMYKKGGNDIILAILRFDGSVVLTDDVDAAFFPDSA